MNETELKKLMPRASASFLKANIGRVAAEAIATVSNSAGLPDTEPCERKEALAADSERETQGSGLLHCRFTLCRKKLLDVDAKYASVKDLLDCLAIARIIRGDKEGQITLEVRQIKSAVEQTVIEVERSS